MSCLEQLRLGHKTRTLAKRSRLIFHAQGKRTGRSRETLTDKRGERQTLFFLFIFFTIPTLSPFGQLPGKKHVGQLALSVGFNRVVVLLAAQVVELDLAHGVCGRRQVDYPGRHRVFQQVQQQISQEKVT